MPDTNHAWICTACGCVHPGDERRRQDVSRFRSLGLAIQEAIQSALADRGLPVEVVDKGLDFTMERQAPSDLEEMAVWLEVGSQLLLIKATTTGNVRMTSAQTETAASEWQRYTLCVVDLQHTPEDQLDRQWTGTAVRSVATVVTDIGEDVKDIHNLVKAACDQRIPICNESVLRYEVPFAVWSRGVPLDDWIDGTFDPGQRVVLWETRDDQHSSSMFTARPESRLKPMLASPNVLPPTSSSYWVVPGLLLAGSYPGHRDPEEHRRRVRTLLDAGIRSFVSLMEPDETNCAGDAYVPYADLAHELCPDAVCVCHPIRDLSVPTKAGMMKILNEIDGQLEARRPVYVHCLGGVGRTGTVIACWLLRHRLADRSAVVDVLTRLRQQDRDRRHRMSPETAEQQKFVREWRDTDDTR